MSINDRVRVQELTAGGVFGGRASARLHETYSVAVGGQVAKFVRAYDLSTAFVGDDVGRRTVVRVEELSVVCVGAYGVIPEQPIEINAFQYDLDGHIFYGMHVRERGTFLYDLMTQQWSPWDSGDIGLWNAQFHVRWNGDYYAQSLLDNSVVRINPFSLLDDSFRSNVFRVTGRLESQERRYVPNPEMQLYGSVGIEGGPITLRYSDNDGETWSSDRVVNVPVGRRSTNVMWYNLGSITAPGRLYEIEHEGAIRRIQSLRAGLSGVPEE